MDEVLRQYAEKYEPTITLEESAVIAHRPLGTIYDWSSQGLFDAFKTKQGRMVLLGRDAFIRFLFEGK